MPFPLRPAGFDPLEDHSFNSYTFFSKKILTPLMLILTFFHKKIPKNPTITLFQISYCPGKAEILLEQYGRNVLGELQTHQNGPPHAPKRLSEKNERNPLVFKHMRGQVQNNEKYSV